VVVNAGDAYLRCPTCGASALADDDFCESCGAPHGRELDAVREHLEIDAGSAAGVSDRGLRHARNEDAMFVAVDDGRAVAVVCDGVSVSAAPHVASQFAADATGYSLLEAVRRNATEAVGVETMADCLARGRDAVASVPWLVDAERSGPSCTAVAAVWDGDSVTLGWAGDSRAYWVDDDGVRLLTLDHSWAQDQVANGAMAVDVAELDPRAHVITRWLGDDAPEAAETAKRTPEGCGRLVLCTDGLWNVIGGEDELAALIGAPGEHKPLTLARRLVSTAIDRGGPDNVTVAVIDVDPGRLTG
jgi:serine/threonine protein phosphatase PrpC